MEEKKSVSWEIEKKRLNEMVSKLQEMIEKCMERIAQMEEKELMEGEYSQKEKNAGDIDAYDEQVDYNASQDSVESFGTKLGISQKINVDQEKDKDGPTRRSDRNLDKKDSKIEDLAKERAADKDNYGKNELLSAERISLFDMSSRVGIDLGCSIEMINQNIDLVASMEQARRDIYLQSLNIQKNIDEPSSSNQIDIGDAVLEELCSDQDHSDVEMEMDYYDNLKKIFSSNKKVRGGSPTNSCGKHTISIGGLARRKYKKK